MRHGEGLDSGSQEVFANVRTTENRSRLNLMKRIRSIAIRYKSVLSIAAGSAGGQLLGAAALPLLARFYTPSDFGVLAVITAYAVMLASVSTLRIELAIPLPADDEDARAIVRLCFVVALVTFSAAVVVSVMIRPVLSIELLRWSWAIAPIALSMSLFTILNQYALRELRFGAVGRRSLIQSVVTATVQVGLGVVSLGPFGLLIGYASGYFFGAGSLLPGSGVLKGGAHPFSRLGAMLRRYRRFPLLLAPSGLLNVAGVQLPIVFMAWIYGGDVAGWLGMTQRVIGLPVTLIGTAMAQVYLAHIARRVRSDLNSALALFYRATRGLLVAAGLLLMVTLILAPTAFQFVLGSEWGQSGDYARALAFGMAAQLVASPLSQTLIALERAGTQFAWDASRAGLVLGGITIVSASGASPIVTIWVLSGIQMVCYVSLWWLCARALGKAALFK